MGQLIWFHTVKSKIEFQCAWCELKARLLSLCSSNPLRTGSSFPIIAAEWLPALAPSSLWRLANMTISAVHHITSSMGSAQRSCPSARAWRDRSR
jgi:hypothetical protein